MSSTEDSKNRKVHDSLPCKLCKLAVPYFCSPHGNFWAGDARLWTDHAVMALLLCMRILHAKTGTTLVDMTWRRAMLQNLFPGSVAEESGSSWDHETVQLWNYTSGASVIQRLDLWCRWVEDWACYCGGPRKRNNVVVGARSDQQVNICRFTVRCDRMWPNT